MYFPLYWEQEAVAFWSDLSVMLEHRVEDTQQLAHAGHFLALTCLKGVLSTTQCVGQ
jgi:hypothetical protein